MGVYICECNGEKEEKEKRVFFFVFFFVCVIESTYPRTFE